MNLLTKIKLLNTLKIFNITRYFTYKRNNKSPRKIKFYKQFLSEGDLCFDIGSNIGEKVDLFLKLGTRVIAIEPQRECYQFLTKIYGKNKNVVILNAALDERKGEKTLYICEANALSTMSENWIAESKKESQLSQLSWNNAVKVNTDTLDEFIQQYGKPRFCKIDVEGFELNVLKGLTQPIPYISFEIAERNFEAAVKCVEHLDSIAQVGFKHCPYEKYKFSNSEWLPKSHFIPFIESLPPELITGDIYAKFQPHEK